MHATRSCTILLATSVGACVIDEVSDYEVGDARWCEAATPWPTDYGELEEALFDRIATLRRQGRECGDDLHNPVASPELSAELRCAARVQATYLAEHDEATHDGIDDTSALSRAALAGYRGSLRYELLAVDFAGAGTTLGAWLEDEDHCSALFDRTIVDIGVGHSRSASGDGAGWVVMLGEQRND